MLSRPRPLSVIAQGDNAAEVQTLANDYCADNFSGGIDAQTSTCFGTLVGTRALTMLHMCACVLPMPIQ